jgi:hypothetical protein
MPEFAIIGPALHSNHGGGTASCGKATQERRASVARRGMSAHTASQPDTTKVRPASLLRKADPETGHPAAVDGRSAPLPLASDGWRRDRASVDPNRGDRAGNSSDTTQRPAGSGRRQQGRYSPVPWVIVLHVQQPDVRFSLAQMNAQQMAPGDYWRGPDRRPEHRPVVTTGARRPPGAQS